MKLIDLLNIAADPEHNPEYLSNRVRKYIDKHSTWLAHPDIDEAVSAEIQMLKEKK